MRRAILLLMVAGCEPLMAQPGASATAPPTSAPSTPPAATADSAGFATVTGKVADAGGEPLDGALVTVRSPQKPFANGQTQLTVMTRLGTFVVNGCPTGVTLTLMATKVGYRAVTQTFVPLVNADGDPRANQVPFTEAFALHPL